VATPRLIRTRPSSAPRSGHPPSRRSHSERTWDGEYDSRCFAPTRRPSTCPALMPPLPRPSIPTGIENERLLELFFSQSLDGFFFMMLDEPVEWNDTVDKDQVLDWAFEHLRMTKVNTAILTQFKAS